MRDCVICGTPFWCIGSRLTGPVQTKNCSRKCAHASTRRDIATVFWPKVDKNGPDGCWIWNGSRKPKGYGHLRVQNKDYNAHRWSYEQAKGPIPHGLEVMHICDVPYCVNPDHLRVGTHAENMADMRAKNRHYKGGNKPLNEVSI